MKTMDEDVRKELDELRLTVKELHQLLHYTTTQETTPLHHIAPLKAMHKRVIKKVNKAQIIKAIKHYIDEGYRTVETRDEIMIRFKIGEACFYNYLRELQQSLHYTTTRNATRKK